MGDAALLELAEAHGVLRAWHDIAGVRHDTTPATAEALLRAMGVLAARDEAAERLAAHRARPPRLPPAAVVPADTAVTLPAPGLAGRWRLQGEDGSVLTGTVEDGAIALAPLAMGLHRLVLMAAPDHGDCLLVAAPPRAPALATLAGGDRLWGVTGAIHALWSGDKPAQNAPPDDPLGDRSGDRLGDGLGSTPGDGRRGRSGELGRAMRALGGLGAAFFGVNPVHALGAAHGGHSPYSPTHRVFLDPAIARVPDHDPVAVPPAPDTLIDHAAARAAHDDAMRRAFFGAMAGQGGPDAPLGPAALAAFRARHGPALEAFALFEALSLDFGADWRAWPTGFEAPDTPAAAAFAARRGDEVTYHAWLQLAAETALAEAQAAARAGGMALGLYTDLAVGVRPDGAEIWAEPGVFARGVSLGAPPDMFSPDGQSWGLAPFAPPGLAAAGYAPFVAMLRAAMRHAGLVRIDHVLGLERTFWVPEDGTPGGYVRAEREVLLAILRVEAVRHGCGVVGEDLGVVPEGLREALDGAGIFGCSVAMYEHWEGRLRAPWHYRPATLASFGTHDTPTLAGWWRGHDIGWREHIGHTAAAEAEAMRAARWRDRATLMALMAEAGVLPPGYDPANPPWEVDDALIAAVHALLARAASALVAVQLDDALGTLEQANIPGTIDEHPNWRRRHAAAAEALGDHPLLRQIAKLMRDAGRVPVREIAEPAAGRG